MSRAYSFANTPLNAAHAPLAMARTSHAGLDPVVDIVQYTSAFQEWDWEWSKSLSKA